MDRDKKQQIQNRINELNRFLNLNKDGLNPRNKILSQDKKVMFELMPDGLLVAQVIGTKHMQVGTLPKFDPTIVSVEDPRLEGLKKRLLKKLNPVIPAELPKKRSDF